MRVYIDNIRFTEPKGELYRYCKEEGLDYLYTMVNINGKRKRTRNLLIFLKQFTLLFSNFMTRLI